MMLKTATFILSLLITTLAFITTTSSVQARELPSQNWQCMSVKVDGHTATLTTKEGNFFAPRDSNVYIVECVSSSGGNACSTGDSAADNFLGLSGMPGFTITNDFPNPVKATLDGKTEGEPHRRTTDGPDANHSFFGVQLTEDVTLDASGRVQKFSTFYPTNSDTNCVSLRWDPTGIVFDSKTLEPVPGVSTTIYNENGSKVNLPGVPNPDITGENGQYNFNVEPNKYYSLNAVSPTHTFPSVKSALPAGDDPDFPYLNIYKGGLFFETPKILRLDIPVDSATPLIREVKITDWKVMLDKPLNLYKIDGGVTHPYSKVFVYNASRLVGQTIANQYGKFIVSVDSTLVNATAPLEITVEKADVFKRILSLLEKIIDKIIPEVHAQTTNTSIKIDPIPNYLEGYAFAENGEIVPNAIVQIVLTVSTKPSLQVKADSKGYFRISSEYLPPLPYNIVIKSPQGTTSSLSTIQFASYNRQTAQSVETNYGQYRTVTQTSEVLSEPKTRSLQPPPQDAFASPTPEKSETLVSTTPDQTLQNLLILVVILIGLGGTLLFLYKKKKALKDD